MDKSEPCPECGANLPHNAPLGVCPKCLLRTGFGGSLDGALDESLSTADTEYAPRETLPRSLTTEPTTGAGGFAPAQQYFGDYELVQEIARGGMGVVFKARQLKLNRIVAIKMIRVGQLANEQELERFFVESEAAASLDHPGIVPIFEVGQENGQHYYSMAYVTGPSLAKLLQDGPLDPTVAAALTKKVADAVEYAHSRGVIHRDLKPANILLARTEPGSVADPVKEPAITSIGEPRVTDFGLAKHTSRRSDLTETGQVLGTPSYMPPEQAQGKTDGTTETSDVYSLGAILYACLTGRPPFQAANPLETLLQVVEEDPVEPKQLNTKIPRALETICLKCLEKEPDRRYGSMRDLADDLGRFLRDEPILARPMSFMERGTRWVRQQGGNVMLGLLTMAVTAVFVVLSLASWYSYSQWNLGLLSLDTDASPLVAEFFDSYGHRVGSAETVPTAEPMSLPAEEYTLRASGEGRLSETYRAALQRDDHKSVELNLDDQLLWPPVAIQKHYDLVNLDGRTDLIQMRDEGIVRFDGKVRWSVPLEKPESEVVKDVTGFVWPWPPGLTRSAGRGKYNLRPHLAATSDIDGDDANDLLVASRHQAWIMGVSGATGEILWLAARGSDTLEEQPKRGPYRPLQSTVVGAPKLVDDLDHDGVSDLITMFADTGGTVNSADFWVEAISSATGHTIWKFELQPDWFHLPPGIDVPYHFKLFTGAASGVQGGSSSSSNHGRERTRGGKGRPVTQRGGSFVYAPDEVKLVGTAQAPLAVFTAGRHLVALDVTTGSLVGQVQTLPHRPIRSAIVAEADDAGVENLVLLGESVSGSVPGSVNLTIWSVDEQRALVSKALQADFWMRPNFKTPRPEWPQVEDIDGDGRDEIIVPNGSSGYTRRWPKSGWGSLEVIDGVTGEPQWQRQLRTMDEQIDRFLVGPDIDGDGHREVYVATLLYKKAELYIDCVSGKDGAALWMERHELSKRHELSLDFWLGNLQWKNAGPSKWPQLVVPVLPDPDAGKTQPSIYVVAAGTGKLQGIGQSMESVQIADMDGDGLEELVAYTPEDGFEKGGTLNVIRGSSSEAWRRIGNVDWQAAGDLDQDGIPDLAQFERNHKYVMAVSGSDGHLLWKSRIPTSSTHLAIMPLGRDLNGDNTPDIITVPDSNSGGSEVYAPFHAISGRDGRRLWTADIQCNTVHPVAWLQAQDLDGDGQLEVLLVNQLDWQMAPRKSRSTKDGQLWLVNLNGRNGRVKWHHALSGVDQNGEPTDTQFEPHLERDWIRVALGDLNEDGTKDILLPAEDPDTDGAYQMKAINGRDGDAIWAHRLPLARDRGSELTQTAALVSDIDGDAAPEIVLLEVEPDSTSKNRNRNTIVRLRSLDRTDGSTLWQWQASVDSSNTIGPGPASNEYRRRLRPTPRKVRVNGTSESLICLNLWGTSSGTVVIDHNGQEKARHSLANGKRPGVWPVDLDNDGNDELISYNDAMISAIEVSQTPETIWKHPIPRAPNGRSSSDGIIQVTPSDNGQASSVVIRRGASVQSIDSTTGKVSWTLNGPQAFGVDDRDKVIPMTIFDNATKTSNVNGIAYTVGDVTICQSPAAVGTDSALKRPVPRFAGNTDDPRLLRDLPWLSEFAIQAARPVKAIVTLAGYLLLSTLLIAIPALYLGRLVGRGHWSLASFLLLPVILGIIMLALTMPTPDYHLTITQRFLWGIAMLPAVVFPAACTQWALRREWRRMATWLAATIVLSLGIGCAILLADSSGSTMATRYSWRGWYTILLYGTYWIGWAIIVTGFRQWLATTAKRWLRRRQDMPNIKADAKPAPI